MRGARRAHGLRDQPGDLAQHLRARVPRPMVADGPALPPRRLVPLLPPAPDYTEGPAELANYTSKNAA